MVERRTADPTRGSLREIVRRGTLVVPGQRELIIEHCTADVTSTSLRKNGPDKRVPPKLPPEARLTWGRGNS